MWENVCAGNVYVCAAREQLRVRPYKEGLREFGFYLDMLCTWFFMMLIGSSGSKDAQLAFWSLRGLSTTLYGEVRCKPISNQGCIEV